MMICSAVDELLPSDIEVVIRDSYHVSDLKLVATCYGVHYMEAWRKDYHTAFLWPNEWTPPLYKDLA